VGVSPDFDQNLHIAATDHSLFVRQDIGRIAKRETAEPRTVLLESRSGFSPDIGLDAAAANRSEHSAIIEDEQLCAGPLWSRSGCCNNSRNGNPAAGFLRLHYLIIDFTLSKQKILL
jgi:hypothetical protein